MFAALCGGVLWGLARVITVVFAPITPQPRAVSRALAEAAASMVAAAIGGCFVVPALCRYLHVSDLETVSALAVAFGICFWQSVPLLILALNKVTALKLNVATVTPEPTKGVGE